MKLWLTRESGDSYMLTRDKPVICRIMGTRDRNAYVPHGDPIGLRHMCAAGVKAIAGFELEPLESREVEVSIIAVDDAPWDENLMTREQAEAYLEKHPTPDEFWTNPADDDSRINAMAGGDPTGGCSRSGLGLSTSEAMDDATGVVNPLDDDAATWKQRFADAEQKNQRWVATHNRLLHCVCDLHEQSAAAKKAILSWRDQCISLTAGLNRLRDAKEAQERRHALELRVLEDRLAAQDNERNES